MFTKFRKKRFTGYLCATILIFPFMAGSALAAFGPPGGGGGGGGSNPSPEGEALYNSTCFACHGDDGGGRFVRRSIRDFSAWSIGNAVSNVPSMNFLSYLSSTDLTHLENYLAWLPSAGNPELLNRDGDAITGEAQFRENCTGCHALGTSARVGPDLLGHSENCATGSSGGGQHILL